jgi:ORF6N domain.
MTDSKTIVPIGNIQNRILLIRGEKVIVDADLAEFYGVSTKVLNQAVRRNKERFPEDFMFQLNKNEKSEVVTNCDHLENLKFSPVNPLSLLLLL